jgi:hypothetical protein
MGIGKGFGYKVCYDCIGKSGCPGWCTCLSNCICCNCLTARDVKTEQNRIQRETVDLHEIQPASSQ